MRKYLTVAGVLIFACVLGTIVWNLTSKVSPIITTNGRAVLVSDNMYALYLDMENQGPADVLSGIDPETKGQVSFMGVGAGLKPVIPESSKASFSADGAHIMFRSTEELKPGSFISLSLSFENSGDVPAKLLINVGSKAKGDTGEAMDHSMNGTKSEEPAKMDHSMHAMGSSMNVNDPSKAPTMIMVLDTNKDRTASISLQTENFNFVELVEEPAAHVDGEGHGHLYLNGLKIQRMYGPSTKIGALPVGRHEISVTLNTNDHRFYAVNGERVEASEQININE